MEHRIMSVVRVLNIDGENIISLNSPELDTDILNIKVDNTYIRVMTYENYKKFLNNEY